MTYAEVLECGKGDVEAAHARVSKMLDDMTDAAKCVRETGSARLSHEQMSWQIYRLCRGIDFCMTEKLARWRGPAHGVRIEFGSLEELGLILTARGY